LIVPVTAAAPLPAGAWLAAVVGAAADAAVVGAAAEGALLAPPPLEHAVKATDAMTARAARLRRGVVITWVVPPVGRAAGGAVWVLGQASPF
jgi:hypothetical protein